jgi:hypothetical protein
MRASILRAALLAPRVRKNELEKLVSTPRFGAKDQALRRKTKPFFIVSLDLEVTKAFGHHFVWPGF